MTESDKISFHKAMQPKLVRRTSMPDSASNTTVCVVPEVLNALAILSAILVERLAVEQEVKQKFIEITKSILKNWIFKCDL